ncbi:PIN domain-containing protein [Pseudarthrobacter sp. B4EP4b]|uniref:PIN domain-containing protein n=1 Tax=Pseudarthrobacter sp. B4EP4b TaxID=2590664 RepID=UPI00114DD486|nr:PIN domain-containing protein [Pseudarthrobacter sp. B4EP4b]
MTIWTGFEGYKDPTEEEALTLLRESFVVLDTNVLLDLYSIPESARDLALDALEFLQDRLFVPHQVLREFWRNRQSAIAEAPVLAQPLDGVRDELLAVVNSLRPDRERTAELDEIRAQINKTLADLEAQIDDARGKPLDVKQILRDNSLDPVLKRLESILEGRIGESFGSDEESMVQLGLKRFEAKVPPGYIDGKDKKEQIPERGTGDYLLWEQALRFVEGQSESRDFVVVTNDSKEDWRIVITQPKKQVLGVRPELVTEALSRTGAQFILLDPRDFYRLMNKIRSIDANASRSLSSALQTVSESRTRDAGEWTSAAYHQLLANLRRDGYAAQADVIALAAATGGLASRAEIYEVAGYADDRSLRRFSMPAQRATISLIDSGALQGEVPFPLEAVYEGPGKTIGYEVPDEFVRFAAADQDSANAQLTWIDAATQVAEDEPERVDRR